VIGIEMGSPRRASDDVWPIHTEADLASISVSWNIQEQGTGRNRREMAKQRKFKKRARVPSVELLEQLLKTGDAETYGLVCWYLANRGTERHRGGDVINLGVWEKASVERKFQLTEESIENIGRCLGMRTCGEASEPFMETRQVEPRGECPAGIKMLPSST